MNEVKKSEEMQNEAKEWRKENQGMKEFRMPKEWRKAEKEIRKKKM